MSRANWEGFIIQINQQQMYRELVKTTYQHIRSKQFRSFLILFYRKNVQVAVDHEQVRTWQALLKEISRQQGLKHEPLANKNRFENCLINFKGFKLDTTTLAHLKPNVLQDITKVFMRVQLNYILALDQIQGQKHFRLLSTLQPKKAKQFFNFYRKMTPQQQLGENTIIIPTAGKWPTLFG